MIYNSVSFNEQWVLSLSLEQFMNHKGTQHLFKDKKHLEIVYNLIKNAHNLQHASGRREDGHAISD